MILLRPNTTVMFFAALSMILVSAVPVPNVVDRSVHARGLQGETSSDHNSVVRNPPTQKPSPWLPPPEVDLQLGPGTPNLWPPVDSKPLTLPPAAFPPDFPSSDSDYVGGLWIEYKRNKSFRERISKDKIASLEKSNIWEGINPTIRDQLRSSRLITRHHLDRKKWLNGYLILAYNQNQVFAQIKWIQENIHHFAIEASVFDKIIDRVLNKWWDLEPDDMIKLGLADPSSEFLGSNNLKDESNGVPHSDTNEGVPGLRGVTLLLARRHNAPRKKKKIWETQIRKHSDALGCSWIRLREQNTVPRCIPSTSQHKVAYFKMVQSLANLTLLNKAQHQDPTESLSSAFNPATCA
ncbi:hypothetical protein FB446DRAFT_704087 [Lentinula raphanica]|nr:hypothetical protein FB446DRAFT_704087 [Lentinula raphanica]